MKRMPFRGSGDIKGFVRNIRTEGVSWRDLTAAALYVARTTRG
jgi:hypothetical protein